MKWDSIKTTKRKTLFTYWPTHSQKCAVRTKEKFLCVSLSVILNPSWELIVLYDQQRNER